MSFVLPTHPLWPGEGTSYRVNCLIHVFRCYTSNNKREHQLTVVCCVSNIIRAFTLRYLYKVRVFRAYVLDNITCSTGVRWAAAFSRNIKAIQISMVRLDTLTPQRCKHPSSPKQCHSKCLKICSASHTISLMTTPHLCRMNDSIWATISWSFYDFRKFLKKKIQSFQSLGLRNKNLRPAYSALLCFKEIWVLYELQ